VSVLAPNQAFPYIAVGDDGSFRSSRQDNNRARDGKGDDAGVADQRIGNQLRRFGRGLVGQGANQSV
jgi:hypothetical protein